MLLPQKRTYFWPLDEMTLSRYHEAVYGETMLVLAKILPSQFRRLGRTGLPFRPNGVAKQAQSCRRQASFVAPFGLNDIKAKHQCGGKEQKLPRETAVLSFRIDYSPVPCGNNR